MLKTAVRRIAPFVLLLLAVLPLFYALFIQMQQMALHHKMKEKLETGLLHSITVKKEQVHWITDGKEIMVEGRMFDIKSSHFQNGICTFEGLYDGEETDLMEQLQKNQHSDSSNSKQLVQLFQLLQTLFSNSSGEEISVTAVLSPEFPVFHSSLSSQFISLFTPPPQAV